MYFDFKYHQTLDALHIGCEAPRAYYIPYASEADARASKRGESDFFSTLCGVWDFKYYTSLNDIGPMPFNKSTIGECDKLTVPKSWQMELGRGYDEPHYTNHNYAIPIDPPFVPEDNPCGVYMRSFYADGELLAKKDVFINFEGVDSCFYLFVNGEFVGYSQVSHTTSEFNIGSLLCAGENKICVVVLKWCDGTYLEDQDKFRMSGIFREVYLLYRDRARIRDILIEAPLGEDLLSGEVNISAELIGKPELECKLLAPDGGVVAEKTLKNGESSLCWRVSSPMLWSDEAPTLYTLLIHSGEEYLCFDVGFRRIEVINKVVYINGQKVKAKGVNRHDTHPLCGAAVPLDMLLKDMYIVKANNMNMVRTSHYPNDPRLPGICNKLGIYLIDEADLECHGMYRCMKECETFSDDPAWQEAYLDRMQRMLERDKNNPSVIIWSPGNESGTGCNMIAVANYVHERLRGSIFIDNGATNIVRDNENADEPTELDASKFLHYEIETSMYRSYDMYVEKMIKNPNVTRPLLLIEHSHAMGNGPGCLYDYWKNIYAHDEFFGGCVWELIDHAVDVGTPGSPRYLYGGDIGYEPHDINFCVDGLLDPDRAPHPGMLEYKQIIKPFRLEGFDLASRTLRIKSLRYFVSMTDLDAYWRLEQNGVTVFDGVITRVGIAPQQSVELTLDIPDSADLSGECFLTLSLRQNTSKPWAPVGYEVGFEQVRVDARKNAERRPMVRRGACTLTEDRTAYRIAIADSVFTVDKLHGVISSIEGDGKQMLSSPIVPNIIRAKIDNDKHVNRDWEQDLYYLTKTYCRSCRVVEQGEDRVVIHAELVIASNARPPVLRIGATYEFTPADGLCITLYAKKRKDFSMLPRFGVTFKMPRGNERLTYFGRGESESYADKHHASRMGLYGTTVTNNFYHYIKPQENSAHMGTKWFEVLDAASQGLLVLNSERTDSFSFNCSHYTAEQLMAAKHDFELSPSEETVVYIDLKQSGIGSESCGLALDERYRFDDEEFCLSFRIQPTHADDTDPFAKLF